MDEALFDFQFPETQLTKNACALEGLSCPPPPPRLIVPTGPHIANLEYSFVPSAYGGIILVSPVPLLLHLD